jgi:trimeric autotransporter adhesin
MNLIASQGGTLLGQEGVALNLIIPGVTAVLQSGQTVTIERGQSVPVDVQVTSRGQYSGDVQVSLEGLPAGLTATVAKVSFTGSSDPEQKSVQVIVTASGSVAGGAVPAQLAVTASGKVTRSNVSVTVLMPAVVVNFDQADNGFVYQGQQKNLAFTVKSVYGFNTPVTLNLTGLPEGVTADPVVVPVTANQESRGAFTLRTTAGPGYGITALAISGSDLSTPTTPTQVEIRPAYLGTLSADPEKMVTAHDGVWLVGNPQADVTPGHYQLPIRRVTRTGVAVSTTLPIDSGYISAVGSPTGDLVILGSTQILRVKDDGSSVVWTYQTMFSISSSPAVVDAQNQLWFYIFGNGYQLLKYNLDSGQVQAVRSESGNNGKTRLYRNGAGDFIYVTGADNGNQVRQFKTATGENKLLNIPVSDPNVFAYAVSQSGNLLIKTDTSLLTLSSAGTVTSMSELSVADSMVFDGDQTLWMTKKNSATLSRVDTVTQKSKRVPVGTTIESSPATGAGLWLISAEAAGSNSVYLSLIP